MEVIEDTRRFPAGRPEVIDLRGAGSPPPTAVLADPTGRRAALLRTAGRVVAAAFVLWFCGLVLAGLGLLPLSDLPLARSLGPTSEPTKLRSIPRPAPPARRDLRPARPLPTTMPVPIRSIPRASRPTPLALRRKTSGAGQTTPGPGRRVGAGHKQVVAPTSTAPPSTAPTAPGNSGTAPGRTRPTDTTTTSTTTTSTPAPGRSGTAPGHDAIEVPGRGAALP